MIELISEKIEKNFGSKKVLKGLSFTAKAGVITFLAGPNGAGKTTWVRIATGLAHPTSGKVRFGNSTLGSIRGRLAASFDEPAVYPHLSGWENLAVISGVSMKSSKTKEIINSLGLEGFINRRAGVYSFGQKKRLSICAALLRDFDYLLLDEPMIGLDPDAWFRVKKMLQEFKHEGKVIFLTGQNLDAIQQLVDYVVILKEGVSAYEGSLSNLVSLRPPKVRVVSNEHNLLRSYLKDQIIGSDNDNEIIISCTSIIEAQNIVNYIKSLDISVQALEIVYDTLEEAYSVIINGAYGEPK